MATSPTINVLLTSFPGLGLPSTLNIPTLSSASISSLISTIRLRLPPKLHDDRLILTTTDNLALSPSSSPVSTLLSTTTCSAPSLILPLRLTAPLLGGKGGFGSQLRAAGGRMSSRKKQSAQNREESTGSYRTLDGRRVHTVNYARRLAEQLEVRPEMQRREKEEKRRRWTQVVQAAEAKMDELRSGGAGAAAARARLDGKWVEDYDEALRKTRDAVLRAADERESDASAEGSAESAGSESDEQDPERGEGAVRASSSASPDMKTRGDANGQNAVKLFGWDDEDDNLSEDDGPDESGDEEVKDREDTVQAVKGKGKAKA